MKDRNTLLLKAQIPPVGMRAEKCARCGKEYTFRKMGKGSPYEGKPICDKCLPAALKEETDGKSREEVTPNV
jgi:hypothetical protein